MKPASIVAGLAVLFVTGRVQAESHLMRFADVHGETVVFTYEGDLWLASTAGGDARRITNDPGTETYAKFSPDGRRLAFTANYDGGTDVYVMDAPGGVPTRLTFHPADDNVLDWFPDGRSVLFRSRRNYPYRADQIYRVPADGGMEELLPVDRAGLTAISPDGRRIAYNRISTEFRTWKRYQGGMAPDIWMGSLEEGDYRPITDWTGTDNFPMWAEDGIYFTSDREHGTLNICRYEPATKKVTVLTHYADYDVKYPSLGPGAIIYQHAETLHLFDLKTGRSRRLDIRVPTDLVKMRPAYVDAAANTGAFGLSPGGARMILEARGEIINLPAERGVPINLTRTSGSREKNCAWSPDGRHVAFVSDRTGEEEVYLADPAGEKPWRQLTKGGAGLRLQLVWSPDSNWLLFSDKHMKLNLVNAGDGEIHVVDQGEYDDGWERWGIQDYVWSPDSRWIAYTKMQENMNESIHLYSLETRRRCAVTSDTYTSWSPSFDRKGRYLYFLSNRTFRPVMGTVDQNHIFLDMCRPYVVLLKSGTRSPFAPEDIEEKPTDDGRTSDKATTAPESDDTTEDKAKPEKGEAAQAEPDRTEVDVAGLEARTIAAVNVPAGNYFRLEATDTGFLYLKKEAREFMKYQVVTDTTSSQLDLYSYNVEEKDPSKREPKKLLSGINNYHLSADGKKLVYRAGATFGVVDAAKEAAVGDGKVDLGAARIKIDRREEFMQMFNEAWRVQRDFFYDPGLHGERWDVIGEMYRKFVPFCGNRSDLTYLIGEMISELNAGHTYVYGGDVRDEAVKVSTGLLGADFDTPAGSAYHRFRHIVPAVNWDEEEYSPLAAPDCPIREGDYLIAIDGEEIRSADNVYRTLENKAGRPVRLTYNSRPARDGAKTYLVKTTGSEHAIRYREWVEGRRAYVAKAGGGRIGYLHLPDMMEAGLIEFARAFHPQHAKEALVIDVRYNGGGFTGDMIVDRLERQLWSITQPREGKPVRNPEGAFHGHVALVINEDTGSNGEYFSYCVKVRGLARLFGMRTWGGAVGIEPHQPLVDGGTVTPPQFAPYGPARGWLIEGHGVDPDVEVQNMPADVLKGKDAQLDAAVKYLLEKLEKEPRQLPPTPPYPKKAKPRAV